MKKYTIYSDGGARPNPGKAISLIKVTPEDFIPSHEYTVYPHLTNNQAEYQALLMAFRKAQLILDTNPSAEFTFLTDSNLIIGHLVRGWRIKKNHGLVTKARELYRELKQKTNITLKYIPRDKNIAGQLLDKHFQEFANQL